MTWSEVKWKLDKIDNGTSVFIVIGVLVIIGIIRAVFT